MTFWCRCYFAKQSKLEEPRINFRITIIFLRLMVSQLPLHNPAGGGAVSSRSFDLLNSMIYRSRWSVDLRWMIEYRCYIHPSWSFLDTREWQRFSVVSWSNGSLPYDPSLMSTYQQSCCQGGLLVVHFHSKAVSATSCGIWSYLTWISDELQRLEDVFIQMFK